MRTNATTRLATAALAAAALLAGGAGPAAALRIEVEMSGVLSGTLDGSGVLAHFGIDAGDLFSGYLHYDVPIPDADGSASVGSYTDPDTELFLQHDASGAFALVEGGPIEVRDASADLFEASGTPDTIDLFPTVEGVVFRLRDSAGTVFASDALPTALDLGDFDLASILVSGPDFVVEGDVTSLTVPEPAAGVALLAPGVAGLALLRGRRGRRR